MSFKDFYNNIPILLTRGFDKIDKSVLYERT